MKSLVLRLFKLADGEPFSKLLVSQDDQTNGQVTSRAWERKGVAKSWGNKFRYTGNKRNLEILSVIVYNRVELDEDPSSSINKHH